MYLCSHICIPMFAVASYIDYTILKIGTTTEQVDELCRQALEQQYAAVCVPPYYVPDAAAMLEGSEVKVCTVVGFPHGMHLTQTKLIEGEQLIQAGAQELDLVSNLSALRNQDHDFLKAEIGTFSELCRSHSVTSKVIIESGLLDFPELQIISEICVQSGIDIIKTSTGFAGVGAELEKVAYLREILPSETGIKASGGIRDLETAQAFIQAGATRIGTSTLIVDPS